MSKKKRGPTKADLCEVACITGEMFDEIADASGIHVPPNERGAVDIDWREVAYRHMTTGLDLLVACESAMNELSRCSAAFEKANMLGDMQMVEGYLDDLRAAIAKATGSGK